ncbi:hypothetical protein ACIPSA_29490 [Streptomyces sp. NPDC086549]|uniref:hypothetical protein n=1 Tax=Streptomyces sp. NPDC086549 TaxID=3365752 RepID=UPI00382EA3D2
MTQATEKRIDIAATVVSLAAEATELQTRIKELCQELVNLDERMTAISAALQQLSSS